MSDLNQNQKPDETAPGPKPNDNQQSLPGFDSSPKNEDYQKALKELQSERSRREELERKIQERENEELKKSNEWEQYAKNLEEKNKDLEVKYKTVRDTRLADKKFEVLRREARKLGMHEKALNHLEMLDFGDVVVDTDERGRVIVKGADSAIQRLKEESPFFFANEIRDINHTPPNVGASMGTTRTVTAQDILEAEKKALQTRHPDDLANYEKMVAVFRSQRR